MAAATLISSGEQEDRRERCRDTERPFPERHAENLHFGAAIVLRDGLVRRRSRPDCSMRRKSFRGMSRGAVHLRCRAGIRGVPSVSSAVMSTMPPPGHGWSRISEVGGRVAVVEDERMIRPERRQRAHRRADVPTTHPASDHFRSGP